MVRRGDSAVKLLKWEVLQFSEFCVIVEQRSYSVLIAAALISACATVRCERDADEKPYKFGFNIEKYQHRLEEKSKRRAQQSVHKGIIFTQHVRVERFAERGPPDR